MTPDKAMADLRRIRAYVGKHRLQKTTVKRTVLGMTVIAFAAIALSIMIEMPHSTALIAFIFIAMAAPGVAIW